MVKALSNIYSDSRTKSMFKCKNWHYSKIKFTKFEDNKAGITMENKEGDRVLCAGKKAELVRAMIIQNQEVECMIRHLQTRTENGKLREGTFKEIVKFK